MWLEKAGEELGEEVQPNWRFFALRQNNHPDKETFRLWEQPTSNPDWEDEKYAASLYYFWAAEAARRQGPEAFWNFHVALLKAKHEEPKQTLYTKEEVAALAESVGLDMAQFEKDFNDPSCLERLADDHTQAVENEVFGTPTFVFDEAKPAYLKINRVLEKDEAVDFWQDFRKLAADRSFLQEIKRP